MSTEKNKAIVRRIAEEIWHKGNLAAVDEIFATNFVGHIPGMPDISGSEGVKQFVTGYRNAFPDIHWAIADEIAEGDKVVTRYTVSGTHQGDFMGISPTGKKVIYTALSINRFASGKIVEFWGIADALGLMQQLGVIPPPGQGNE